MRDGFRDIVSGWMLVDDFGHLTDLIERSADWAKANGPLEADEDATVKMMIEAQVVLAIEQGDFDFMLGTVVLADQEYGFISPVEVTRESLIHAVRSGGAK